MESFLEGLIPLVAQPHLVPAEQIITLALLSFEEIFQTVPDDSDKIYESIEQVLLPFFSINDGCLSLPASIRIANCLISVYEKSNHPEKWNFINYTSLKLNPASIYGLGQIIDFIGDRIENQLPTIAKVLIDNSKNEEFVLPTLFALNSCLKRSPHYMQPFAPSIFNFAKSAALSDDEPLQLNGLKLLRTLIKKTDLPIQNFLNIAHQVFKKIEYKETRAADYVYLDACYFVARLAYTPFLSLEPEDTRAEWTAVEWGSNEVEDTSSMNSNSNSNNTVNTNVNNNGSNSNINLSGNDNSNNTKKVNELEESFDILRQFSDHFKFILTRFLDLLEPMTIHKNLFTLYEFVREVDETELPQVMSLFGHDVKQSIFKRVAKEQPPTKEQLALLISLYCGEDSTREIAALALQLANSGNTRNRRAAAEFFAELDEWDPDLAEQYLETSMLCLAFPPENNPNMENEIIGFSMIASSILGPSPDRVELAMDNSENIELFLNKFLKVDDVLSPTFEACFVLMTVLPEKLIPKELTSEALARLAGFIEGQDYSRGIARLNEVCRSAAVFLAQHPYFEVIGRLYWHIISLPNLPSRSGILAIIIASPRALEGTSKLANISYMLVEHILSVRPSNSLMMSMVKHPIISLSFDPPLPELIFSYVRKNEFCFRIVDNYPDFILSLKPETATKTISKLLANQTNNAMSHLILLSLIQNEKIIKLLPKGFDKSLFSTVSDLTAESDISEIMELSITAEVLAIYAKSNPKRLASFMTVLEEQSTIAKCILLAAVLSHCDFDNEALAVIMHDLDGIAMISDFTNFALHALSVLFIENSMKLAANGVVDMQCQVMFNLLNSEHVLYPEEMEMVADSFSNFLPIVSPEIETDRSALIPLIKLTVQSFTNVPLPFMKHFTFKTMQAVSAFARKLTTNILTIQFPMSRGISTKLQLVASATLADVLRVSPDSVKEYDFFEYLDDSLVNLQRTADKRASDFILAITQNFADRFTEELHNTTKDQKETSRLGDYIYIIKTILANGALPFTGNAIIEAVRVVKLCALNMIEIILPLFKKIYPFPSDYLTDIMSSLIRAIETRKRKLTTLSYSILVTILDEFKEEENDDEVHILSLYDSQFSTAVRYGFQLDLGISSEFLVAFLWFHLENLKTRPAVMKVILDSYVTGLERCKQRTIAYVGIAACIADIAREQTALFDQVKAFVSKLMPLFAEIINESMNILQSNPPDWAKIAQFRSNYSDFYGDMLSCFVWFQKKLGIMEIIRLEKIVNFCIKEIWNGSEMWRVSSAFEALAVIIETSPETVSMEVLGHAVDVVREMNEASPEFLEYALPLFLRASVKKITNIVTSIPVLKNSLSMNDIKETNPTINNPSPKSSLNTEIKYLPSTDEINNTAKEQLQQNVNLNQNHDNIENQNTKTENMQDSKLENEKIVGKDEEFTKIHDLSDLSETIDQNLQKTSSKSDDDDIDETHKDIIQKQAPKIWEHLMEAALKLSYVPEVLGILIAKGRNDQVSQYAEGIFQDAVDQPSNELYVPVLKLLAHKVPEKSGIFIERIMNEKDIDIQWKLDNLKLFLSKVTIDSIKPSVLNDASKLIHFHFKRGGLKILSEIISSNPKIGFAVLSIYKLEHIRLLIEKEFNNAKVYLQFLRFAFLKAKEQFLLNPEIFERLISVAIHTLNIWGSSSDHRVFKIISLAVNLLQETKEASPRLFKETILKKVSNREMQIALAAVEMSINKKNKSGKIIKLKKFSQMNRKNSHDLENEDGVPIPNEPQ
ncbi:hypothetical protein TRFO_37198 [Tritrichomonas foetus]|uniref:HEAT repeat family protein n=1 Tax=Tritrichomonas foetus TaxID=1144522 RepID=A0A1J4JBQ2_9EUKA|nr:hypothetical protein TRFO_37198 [Tritrichomonas foetus]|eukprot:OHS96614.1 hypothetical protein TRFO_37198 [Tritrichomonas foetus]